MKKIEEHNLKEQIKQELGQTEQMADYLEKLENDKTGPDVDSRLRNNYILRTRDEVPKYLRVFDKERKIKDLDVEDKMEKYSGQSFNFLEQERFAWGLSVNEKIDIANSIAMPTATEKLYRKNLQLKQQKKLLYHESIEELYGKQTTDNKACRVLKDDNEEEVEYYNYSEEEKEAHEEEQKPILAKDVNVKPNNELSGKFTRIK